MIRYVGLDVHKRVVQACIIAEDGEIVCERRFDVSLLPRFAQQQLTTQDHVVLEATTNTWAIVQRLEPHVAEVVVSNPLTTKAIAQAKVKTDKVDALVLAQLLRCDYLPRVWQPDEQTQELRRWTGRRSGLVGQITAIKNRIHSIFHQRLMAAPVADLFGKMGRQWLAGVALDAEGRWMLDSDLRLLAALEAERAAIDQLLAERGHADKRVKLLMSLPGVNVTVAQCLVAVLGDIRRFREGAHAASYLGLVPSTKQSANHCYHGPITKAGSGQARWMLIQAAQHVRLHEGPLGLFFRRLAKKKNYNVAVVATARKMVTIAWQLLSKNEPYRYAQPLATQSKLQRLRVKATGKKRKSGPAKGGTSRSKPGVRTRTIKPLAQVLSEEGLPALTPPPVGEKRMIREAGCQDYVNGLAQMQVRAKRTQARSSITPPSEKKQSPGGQSPPRQGTAATVASAAPSGPLANVP